MPDRELFVYDYNRYLSQSQLKSCDFLNLRGRKMEMPKISSERGLVT